jgi:uncharacterized protein
MWRDLAIAVALMLVLEGLLPFANPGLLRRALDAMRDLSDADLRVAGLASMLLGLLTLFLINR